MSTEWITWLEQGRAALCEALAEVGEITPEDERWAENAFQYALAHHAAVSSSSAHQSLRE